MKMTGQRECWNSVSSVLKVKQMGNSVSLLSTSYSIDFRDICHHSHALSMQLSLFVHFQHANPMLLFFFLMAILGRISQMSSSGSSRNQLEGINSKIFNNQSFLVVLVEFLVVVVVVVAVVNKNHNSRESF